MGLGDQPNTNTVQSNNADESSSDAATTLLAMGVAILAVLALLLQPRRKAAPEHMHEDFTGQTVLVEDYDPVSPEELSWSDTPNYSLPPNDDLPDEDASEDTNAGEDSWARLYWKERLSAWEYHTQALPDLDSASITTLENAHRQEMLYHLVGTYPGSVPPNDLGRNLSISQLEDQLREQTISMLVQSGVNYDPNWNTIDITSLIRVFDAHGGRAAYTSALRSGVTDLGLLSMPLQSHLKGNGVDPAWWGLPPEQLQATQSGMMKAHLAEIGVDPTAFNSLSDAKLQVYFRNVLTARISTTTGVAPGTIPISSNGALWANYTKVYQQKEALLSETELFVQRELHREAPSDLNGLSILALQQRLDAYRQEAVPQWKKTLGTAINFTNFVVAEVSASAHQWSKNWATDVFARFETLKQRLQSGNIGAILGDAAVTALGAINGVLEVVLYLPMNLLAAGVVELGRFANWVNTSLGGRSFINRNNIYYSGGFGSNFGRQRAELTEQLVSFLNIKSLYHEIIERDNFKGASQVTNMAGTLYNGYTLVRDLPKIFGSLRSVIQSLWSKAGQKTAEEMTAAGNALDDLSNAINGNGSASSGTMMQGNGLGSLTQANPLSSLIEAIGSLQQAGAAAVNIVATVAVAVAQVAVAAIPAVMRIGFVLGAVMLMFGGGSGSGMDGSSGIQNSDPANGAKPLTTNEIKAQDYAKDVRRYYNLIKDEYWKKRQFTIALAEINGKVHLAFSGSANQPWSKPLVKVIQDAFEQDFPDGVKLDIPKPNVHAEELLVTHAETLKVQIDAMGISQEPCPACKTILDGQNIQSSFLTKSDDAVQFFPPLP